MVLIVGQNILFMNFIIITEIITAGVRWLIIYKSCSVSDISLTYMFAFYILKDFKTLICDTYTDINTSETLTSKYIK